MSSNSTTEEITGASTILSALEDAGVTQLFVNLGSDHPAFLTAFASGKHPRLKVYTSPNETNALSAASGYAQITGRPAAVLVHVDCGTLGLAGAVHNVSKGRIPSIIIAGTVPITQEGELRGSRNEHIHWIQDVPDQRAIVRQYMRYENEIRTPHNATQIVLRAIQFATSLPRGPTYLTASREVLEQKIPAPARNPILSKRASLTTAVEPIGLSMNSIQFLTQALLDAERPLIVTSYAGKSVEGFVALKELAELCSIAVHENAPICNNFPTTSYLHQGHQWNGGGQLKALAEADLVLVIDSDVPWITAESKPSESARVFHLDADPLKDGFTLWYLPCERRWKCDSSLALRQLVEHLQRSQEFDSVLFKERVENRKNQLRQRFEERRSRLAQAETSSIGGHLTVPYLMSRFRNATRNVRVVTLNESTTNLGNVVDFLHLDEPLSVLSSGGGSLGWYSGAAVGVSLALQEQDRAGDLVVAFTGDGTWLFGVPSSAYWMSRKYNTPFLTIIWNNGGWSSPQNACLRLNPDLKEQQQQDLKVDGAMGGTTQRLSDVLKVSIDPSPAFGKIAEGAGDAWWAIIKDIVQVDEVLEEAVRTVLEDKRSAVVEVQLKRI